MEKLVKLLNEYHFSWTEYVWYYLDEEDNRIYFRTKVVDKWLIDEQRISDERIISKKFWFIKWLVDNDKVEITNIWRLPKKLYINNDWITCVDDMCEDCYYNVYESLLMLLTIKEDSIKFLVDILK